MNRCSTFAAWSLALAGAFAGLAAPPAQAQDATPEVPAVRAFPRSALRGTLVVTAPPEVMLDGKPESSPPGARIRSMQNMLVMSGAMVGRSFTVNYTRDAYGLLHEVWILTDAEIAEKRESATKPRNFLFGSEADAPARDDGKTPYNQLPGYNSPR